MVTANTVCAKSYKGHEEMERRRFRLAPRLRQMLILIDGRRDMAAVQTVFAPEWVPGVLQQRLDGGFAIELGAMLEPASAQRI